MGTVVKWARLLLSMPAQHAHFGGSAGVVAAPLPVQASLNASWGAVDDDSYCWFLALTWPSPEFYMHLVE